MMVRSEAEIVRKFAVCNAYVTSWGVMGSWFRSCALKRTLPASVRLRAASRDEANDLVSARPLLVFDQRAVPDNGFGKRIALVDKDCFRRDRRPDLVDRDPIFVVSDLKFGPVPVRIGAARFPGRRYHRFEPLADRGRNVLKFWPVHCARAYGDINATIDTPAVAATYLTPGIPVLP